MKSWERAKYWNEVSLLISGFSVASPPGRGSKTGNGNFCQKERKGRRRREIVEEEGIVEKGGEEKTSMISSVDEH